jgi:hypothetical protein
MNSSSIASSNGWVELEVTLIEGVVGFGCGLDVEVSFYTTHAILALNQKGQRPATGRLIRFDHYASLKNHKLLVFAYQVGGGFAAELSACHA